MAEPTTPQPISVTVDAHVSLKGADRVTMPATFSCTPGDESAIKIAIPDATDGGFESIIWRTEFNRGFTKGETGSSMDMGNGGGGRVWIQRTSGYHAGELQPEIRLISIREHDPANRDVDVTVALDDIVMWLGRLAHDLPLPTPAATAPAPPAARPQRDQPSFGGIS